MRKVCTHRLLNNWWNGQSSSKQNLKIKKIWIFRTQISRQISFLQVPNRFFKFLAMYPAIWIATSLLLSDRERYAGEQNTMSVWLSSLLVVSRSYLSKNLISIIFSDEVIFRSPTLRKRCAYLELFWSAFSRIWTKYLSVFSPNEGKYGPE